MAVDIAQASELEEYTGCNIYIDSQPAIKATTKPERQSGQAIIREVLDSIESLQAQCPKLRIELVWIPGHMDICGNEVVDKAAKESALSKGTNETAFHHKTLKVARNRTIKEKSNQEWKTAWQSGKGNARQLRRITAKKHTESGPKIYNSISKRRGIANLARL